MSRSNKMAFACVFRLGTAPHLFLAWNMARTLVEQAVEHSALYFQMKLLNTLNLTFQHNFNSHFLTFNFSLDWLT